MFKNRFGYVVEFGDEVTYLCGKCAKRAMRGMLGGDAKFVNCFDFSDEHVDNLPACEECGQVVGLIPHH